MSTLVFDVNETLSDIDGLATFFDEAGAPGSLARTWYAATLRDGLALGVQGTSAGFADVGRQVLRGMLHGMAGVDVDAAVESVLAGFASLDLHPDVADGLRALHDAGHRLITLSVGSASVAQALLDRAGVADTVELMLSCDDVGLWKPHTAAYRYAARRCGVDASELVMVAVHPWDLDGAARAGLTTVFVDRTGAPWPDVFRRPDHRVRTVGELVGTL